MRVDTGVHEGGEISMHTTDDRQADLPRRHAPAGIERMRDALNAFLIRGVSSNIPFRAALMQHPRASSPASSRRPSSPRVPERLRRRRRAARRSGAARRRRRFRPSPLTSTAPCGSAARWAGMRAVGQNWVVFIGGDALPDDARRDRGRLFDRLRRQALRPGLRLAVPRPRLQRHLQRAVDLSADRAFGLDYRISHFGKQVKAIVMTARPTGCWR